MSRGSLNLHSFTVVFSETSPVNAITFIVQSGLRTTLSTFIGSVVTSDTFTTSNVGVVDFAKIDCSINTFTSSVGRSSVEIVSLIASITIEICVVQKFGNSRSTIGQASGSLKIWQIRITKCFLKIKSVVRLAMFAL